jgi:hypothetical protein
MDDHFLLKYRELLDAEDAAFDELEHASEDGDHARFDEEMHEWRGVLARKAVFLHNAGIDVPVPVI